MLVNFRWPDAKRRAYSFAAIYIVAGLFAADPTVLDSDTETGFSIYRSGRLKPGELEELCRADLVEVVAMDGTARERECLHRQRSCPGLRVRFDEKQDTEEPLSEEFLVAFDQWVEESRSAGRTILFRCHHGWHRAGRLAAYYQMRYLGLDAEQATSRMLASGRFMGRHPYLADQVAALYDYIRGRPCSVVPEYCVRRSPLDDSSAPALFVDDVCPTP